MLSQDVRAVVHDVLRHRVGITYEAEAENITLLISLIKSSTK
jgi:MoxR-like ATPase